MVVGRTVVLNDGAPKLARALEDLGYEARPLRLTEFIKAGGSAKCLTLRLDGEEAAALEAAAGPHLAEPRGDRLSRPERRAARSSTSPDPPESRSPMQELYLLRHGLAVPHGTPDFDDDDRPLTPDGERRVRQVGRGLKRLKLKLVRIATSPLPRALKTAEIVADCLGEPDLIEVVDDLRAGRDAASIRDWLATRAGDPADDRRPQPEPVRPHRPARHRRAGTTPFCELRKGGIAALRGEPGGPYRIDWIARPRLFR